MGINKESEKNLLSEVIRERFDNPRYPHQDPSCDWVLKVAYLGVWPHNTVISVNYCSTQMVQTIASIIKFIRKHISPIR